MNILGNNSLGTLTPSVYTYKVTASNSEGTKKIVNKGFAYYRRDIPSVWNIFFLKLIAMVLLYECGKSFK